MTAIAEVRYGPAAWRTTPVENLGLNPRLEKALTEAGLLHAEAIVLASVTATLENVPGIDTPTDALDVREALRLFGKRLSNAQVEDLEAFVEDLEAFEAEHSVGEPLGGEAEAPVEAGRGAKRRQTKRQAAAGMS
jgi:hypothetical protein